jgi:cytochrome P450
LSTASIAVAEAFRYIFGAIATTGDRRKEAVMDWARILAYVTGTVDQELLARNEYLTTKNRILKDQLKGRKGRLMLSDAERATLGEIGHRLGRKILAEVATVARPDTILAWYRKLVSRKFSGSQARQGPGRPLLKREVEQLIIRMASENRDWGYDRIAGAMANLGYMISDQTVGYSATERPATRAGAQAHDLVVGLHSNPLCAASWNRLLHRRSAHAARSGDLLRAVFHLS